jgi:phosphoserine phosphatase RsbU/P
MNSAKSEPTVIDLLREHETLGGLPDAALKMLVETSELIHFAPNEVMLQQGAPSDCALFIVAGEADILVETSYGEIHIAHSSPRMLIGEIGAFTQVPRTATVRARTALDALRIGRPQLLEIGRTNPQLLLFVIGQLGERMSRLNRAFGVYTDALSALENNDFDTKLFDDLLNPLPELLDFSHSFIRLAEQITIKRQRFEEMANAAAIQRSMLPGPFKAARAFAALDLHGELHPAREVGGDFFDHFTIDDRRIVVSIGDVSGKGVPASLFMAITQSLIRLLVGECGDLATGIARVNSLLAANNAESMFATAFCAIIDVETGEIVYSNCGHNAPLLLRRDGAIDRLTPTGPPLAASSHATFKTATQRLYAGDRLILFSDGLPEATSSNGEFFGEGRLEETVRKHAGAAARDLVRGILGSVAEFESGAPRYDDIACVSVVYRGPVGHQT